MKIWDCFPGYLNKTLLLAEHRELHATHNIVEEGLAVSTVDPHMLDWMNHPQAIRARHALVIEEMALAGVEHRSKLDFNRGPTTWPATSRELPLSSQIEQLQVMRGGARLAVPQSVEELWNQCALSVLARDPQYAQHIESQINSGGLHFSQLMVEINDILRQPALPHAWEKTIFSMWEVCAKLPEAFTYRSSFNRPERLIKAIQYLASRYRWPELWDTTAITDLACCSFADE